MELSIKPTNNNDYYLYTVKNDAGTILYAGVDKICDIVTFKTLLPNPLFVASEYYNIDIFKGHSKYFIAYNMISKLIHDLCGDKMPPLNITQHYNRHSNVICNDTGIIYRNASEACKALGIQSPRMSNHLSNKPGHKTIKGLTFRYYVASGAQART